MYIYIHVCVRAYVSEMPSAYDLVKHWRQYHQAAQDGRDGLDVPFSAYGVLGTPGFATGAFLKSPHCTTHDPDIQLTFFPSVCDVMYVTSVIVLQCAVWQSSCVSYCIIIIFVSLCCACLWLSHLNRTLKRQEKNPILAIILKY
jgi:hypothetical protein